MKKTKLIGLISIVLMLVFIAGCVEEDKKTDTSLSDIKAKGTLVVGTDIPYGVMEFYDDNGEPAGIDMDLANIIASRIGVEMKVESMPFNQLFDAVKNGSVDILAAAVTITLERQKEILFSRPYLDAGMRIGIREDNENITSLDDLIDKKVGVLNGTVGENLARESEFINNSLIVSYQANTDRLEALANGTVDAVIVHFLDEVTGVKTVGDPLSVSYYGIVTKLGNDALMDEIDNILRDIWEDGTIDEIKAKYVG